MTARLVLFCNECGAANELQASECFACQRPLEEATPTPAIQPYRMGYRGTVLPIPAPAPAHTPDPTPNRAESDGPLKAGSQLLQRYRILREIGEGGFGVVYLAQDRKQRNKKVAIKQINIGSLKPREIIDATDSYNREVSLLSKLQHKHLPRVYNHFTDQEHWYLVMDYIEGETLEEYLQKAAHGALPLKEALNIGIQVCNVLHYLHTQRPPIIFRDVKPANIMRTTKGKIYLIDFGIARRYAPGRAKDTGPLGSPGYAAPEQYGITQSTVHTDIYGLGATLQTLVTGKDPLELRAEAQNTSTTHTGASGVMVQIQKQRRIPPKMQALLDTMMAKDKDKRPRNIGAVKVKLEQLQEGDWWPLRTYIRGFLIGIAPYIVIRLLPLLGDLLEGGTRYGGFFYMISTVLLCTTPLLFLGQFCASLIMLSSPGKRFTGLGLLTVLVLIVMGLFMGWLIPYFTFLDF